MTKNATRRKKGHAKKRIVINEPAAKDDIEPAVYVSSLPITRGQSRS